MTTMIDEMPAPPETDPAALEAWHEALPGYRRGLVEIMTGTNPPTRSVSAQLDAQRTPAEAEAVTP